MGDLGRPVDALPLARAERAWIEGGRLRWQPYPAGDPRSKVKPGNGMLESFVSLLEDANQEEADGVPILAINSFARDRPLRPQDVTRFAQRFGVFMICEHGVPCTHDAWCRPLGWPGAPWEPLAFWRTRAAEFLALMAIASRLLQGRPGSPEDRLIVHERQSIEVGEIADLEIPLRLKLLLGLAVPRRRDPDPEKWAQLVGESTTAKRQSREVEWERAFVCDEINVWLREAHVTPTVQWDDKTGKNPVIRFGGGGLYGALAVQLALTLGGTSVAFCEHCRKSYAPLHRSPKTGQRHFCPTCRKAGIPNRYAVQDCRERKRKEERKRKRHVKKTRKR